MSQEILNVSNIYQTICMASITGRGRGISVKELKKKYMMKDCIIISFLNSISVFITMKKSNAMKLCWMK